MNIYIYIKKVFSEGIFLDNVIKFRGAPPGFSLNVIVKWHRMKDIYIKKKIKMKNKIFL
jgi:hypothetical protein